jgi:hypothetical protein
MQWKIHGNLPLNHQLIAQVDLLDGLKNEEPRAGDHKTSEMFIINAEVSLVFLAKQISLPYFPHIPAPQRPQRPRLGP